MNVPLTTTIMSLSYTGFGAFNPNFKSKIAFKPRTRRTKNGFLVEYLIPRKNPHPRKIPGIKIPVPEKSRGSKSPILGRKIPRFEKTSAPSGTLIYLREKFSKTQYYKLLRALNSNLTHMISQKVLKINI